MSDEKLPFGWTQKPNERQGYMDLYDRHGRHQTCLPEGIDSKDYAFESMGRETGLSREALEVAIWCSENIDTKQPRLLFDDGDFRIVRISSGESSLIFSENGKIADTFLGEPEGREGPVNEGVLSATVSVAAVHDDNFRARVMSELDKIQSESSSRN